MNRAKLLTLSMLLALAGCKFTPVPTGGENPADPDKAVDQILVLAVQRTGGESDERTFEAIDQILKRHRVSRIADSDKVMLVEVSDTGGPVHSGSPMVFKQKYPDGEAIRESLKVCPGQTRVHDIISETARAVRGISKKAKVTLIVWSPMADGLSRDRGHEYMYGSLNELERHNSLHLRIYGADPYEAERLRPAFEAWLRNFTITSAIDLDPELPGWTDE